MGAGLSAALGAAAAEVNVVVLDLKFARIDLWPGKMVQARIFDIEDASAIQTDEMVMLPELRVEARRRAGMAGPGHKAERNENPQNAMDRHTGDLRELAANRSVKQLSRGVIATIHDRFKDRAALGRDRPATFAMGGEEAVHSLLFVGRAHGPR
jgi:hypothetical protein